MSQLLADCCKAKLALEKAALSPEYYYHSLPQCVIDAVFSIGINYSATRNVVINFCEAQGIQRLREYGSTFLPIEEQFSIEAFLDVFEEVGIDVITERYFKNRCRTSATSGILKSEAVKRFSKVLKSYKVNYFQDLTKLIGNEDFENDIKKIPGQGSGISTKYFYMLAGDESFIKPDRMILRFVETCIERSKVSIDEAIALVENAHHLLKQDYPQLTLRLLDYEIWKYQKDIKPVGNPKTQRDRD